MYISEGRLQEMKQVDIHDVSPDTLVDITEIEIDTKKPVSARIEDYVQKVGNPFLVRVGEYAVKIGYTDCEETLNDRMKQYIEKMAEIKY